MRGTDDRNAKRKGAMASGIYQWGCPCCMSRNRRSRVVDKRIARKAHRRALHSDLTTRMTEMEA